MSMSAELGIWSKTGLKGVETLLPTVEMLVFRQDSAFGEVCKRPFWWTSMDMG
jgi:hypothetical protein